MNIFPVIHIEYLSFTDWLCKVFGHKWECGNPDVVGLKWFRCTRCKDMQL